MPLVFFRVENMLVVGITSLLHTEGLQFDPGQQQKHVYYCIL